MADAAATYARHTALRRRRTIARRALGLPTPSAPCATTSAESQPPSWHLLRPPPLPPPTPPAPPRRRARRARRPRPGATTPAALTALTTLTVITTITSAATPAALVTLTTAITTTVTPPALPFLPATPRDGAEGAARRRVCLTTGLAPTLTLTLTTPPSPSPHPHPHPSPPSPHPHPSQVGASPPFADTSFLVDGAGCPTPRCLGRAPQRGKGENSHDRPDRGGPPH